MPVVIQTGDVAPRIWGEQSVSDSNKLFSSSCEKEFKKSKRVIQSSFPDGYLAQHFISSSPNGFVHAFHKAWSGHHHLIIRPEDVWFSILSQLTFYINAHAEELRSLFVEHEGQKELWVMGSGTINTADFGPLAVRMTAEIEKNVIDPELRTWIMPDFSTTTTTDHIVAAILMMGSMQKYFTYGFGLLCGIPSVTLLGERHDYETILTKLDKLPQLGSEPATFAMFLRPVLKRFIASFDKPNDPEIVDFWKRYSHRSGGSGPPKLSGWITAFCFWEEKGQRLFSEVGYSSYMRDKDCWLDNIRYPEVNIDQIPAGYASVPVTVNDNGVEYKTKMLAGSVGIQAVSSSMSTDTTSYRSATGNLGLDSLKPVTGWWMYEAESKEDEKARKKKLADLKAELDGIELRGTERWYELSREVHELESY